MGGTVSMKTDHPQWGSKLCYWRRQTTMYCTEIQILFLGIKKQMYCQVFRFLTESVRHLKSCYGTFRFWCCTALHNRTRSALFVEIFADNVMIPTADCFTLVSNDYKTSACIVSQDNYFGQHDLCTMSTPRKSHSTFKRTKNSCNVFNLTPLQEMIAFHTHSPKVWPTCM